MTTIVGAVADELRIEGSRLLEGRGGVGRMLVAWLGWRGGLHSLRAIAGTLGLRSLGRVSNLVHEAEALLRSATSLSASGAALRARFA